MRKVLILLAVAMIAANAGGCAHRLRDWFYQGSYCGTTNSAPVVMPQQYAAPCCPTCPSEPCCESSYDAPVTYGPVMSGGAMVAPGAQTFVTPQPE